VTNSEDMRLALLIALAAFLLILTLAVAPAGICLTEAQARQLFPKEHLYWYSKDHCWSNRRGGPPSKLRIDPIPQKKDPRQVGGGVKVSKWDEYNELDAAADQELFFQAKPLPFWQSVIQVFRTWEDRIGGAFNHTEK